MARTTPEHVLNDLAKLAADKMVAEYRRIVSLIDDPDDRAVLIGAILAGQFDAIVDMISESFTASTGTPQPPKKVAAMMLALKMLEKTCPEIVGSFDAMIRSTAAKPQQ